MTHKTIIAILPITLLIVMGCGQWGTNRGSVQPNEPNDTTPQKDSVGIVRRDSVDVLIEERAKQEFNSTIFAGLRFGDSEEMVWKALKNRKPIQVPVEDKVYSVTIRDYKATYYHGKLASLMLYANEANLYDALGSFYALKYGQTKKNKWVYSNCEITIYKWERKRRAKTTYDNTYPIYYDSYFGKETSKLTNDAWFLAILYVDTSLTDEKEQEEEEALVKQAQIEYAERQKEREFARKLSTELPTNI